MYVAPQYLHTDNASIFRSRVFEEMLLKWGVEHVFSPSHCSRPNNSERTNRVIEELLRAKLSDNPDQRNWENYIHQISCAIRISHHEATQESPYRVVFGKDYVVDGQQYQYQNLDLNVDSSVRSAHMRAIWQEVDEHIRQAREVARYYYDQNSKERKFYVGQILWKKEFPISSQLRYFNAKLAPRYRKVRVKEVVGYNTNTCRVEDLDGNDLGIYYAEMQNI